jgi:hypothetical protein
MKKSVRMLAALPFLTFASAAAPQQPAAPAASQPAQPAQAPEKPRLNLRLDDRDLRSAVPYTPNPKEAGGKDAADSLPGLGGKPSTSWDQPAPEVVVPKSNDKL